VCDVSEREWQKKRSGQWIKGKSADTFGPIGPYIVTKDEIKDLYNLNMSLDVNGKRMQTGNTSKMIHKMNFLTSYTSEFMTLMPGDIITTGTPPGVGDSMKPPTYLNRGDVLTLAIDQLGSQKHSVK
jgi:2,4-didehydro-3-deoxy-L-rhamnonate hydrolase